MKQRRLFEPEVPIPEELRPAVDLWLPYKRQQWHFTYKPIALGQLLERMAEMGPERAMAAVKHSISAGYQGLVEPKNGNGAAHGGPPERYKPFMNDSTIDRWPYMDKSEQRGVIESITMGHPKRYR
jgi:hypothetical protein